jgi:starch-binding outer membrane protein, SusD/RagB family
MKNKIAIGCLLAVLLGAGLSSCKKYLDRTPLSSVSQRDFYSNADQVQQGLTGVYNAIGARSISPGFNNPTPYYSKMDLFTELGIERGLSGTVGSGSYDPTNGTVSELWAGFFQVVQRANNLLFYMPKAQSVMTPTDYNRVVAESKVLRAMAYWYLISYYGDVPFFTTPPATSDEIYNFKRTSKSTIIKALIPELEAAANDLDWAPAQAGRVSKGVALGVAARLAMLDKNYTYAAQVTDNIIANGPYGLNPSFQNLFRLAGQKANTSNEIMFWYPYGDSDPGSYTYIQLVQGSRNQGGQSSQFPTQFMVDLFECKDGNSIATSPLYNPAQPNKNRDPRMAQTVIVPGDTVVVQGFTSIVFDFADQFIASYNPTTKAITFPSTTANQDSANIFGPRQNGLGNMWRKYVQDRDVNGTAGNLFRVGWIYMRFAEILLINAEAHLEKGDPATTVVAPVNRVRARAGMPAVTAAVQADVNQLRQLVRREKMVELANEGLHWPDLQRWDDGAYAAKVMPLQLYGEAKSGMRLTATGLEFITPAPAPTFDATYNVPISWPNGDQLRLKREQRIFNKGQHNLLPVPLGEILKNPNLTQNPSW